MSEAAVLQAIRLALGRHPNVRLFRNNAGVLRDQHGRPVRFGLHPGSADLIGYRRLLIQPEHVGTHLAVFASIEVKTAKGRLTEQQRHWAEVVCAAGGLAGVARSPDEAAELLGLPYP